MSIFNKKQRFTLETKQAKNGKWSVRLLDTQGNLLLYTAPRFQSKWRADLYADLISNSIITKYEGT